MIKRFTYAFLFFIAAGANIGVLQAAEEAEDPEGAIISLYRVAPGKHLDFLKWMEARENIAKELGVGAIQWYVHWSGDSWDYLAIGPFTTDEQDQKMDDAAKAKGLTTGMAASLEFRTMMASHTDTMAGGPFTIYELMKKANE